VPKVPRAIRDGASLAGYFVWSLLGSVGRGAQPV